MDRQIKTVKPHAEASAVIQSELIAALGVTSEIIDRIIAWLETRRDKNINTTLSILGRKVREWNQPYVDALKPDWYV